MAKKRISKSRKKSYLKRNSRRTIRRKDKRKIKKTRKKRLKGGAKTVGLTGLTPRGADLVSGGKYVKPETASELQPEPALEETERETKIIEDARKILDISEEEMDVSQIETKVQIKKHKAKRFGGNTDEIIKAGKILIDALSTSDREDEILLIAAPPAPAPSPTSYALSNTSSLDKYLVIVAHGKIQEDFTLIPRKYSLILPTATGQALIYNRKNSRQFHDGPTRFSLYTGLVSEHTLDWEVVHKGIIDDSLKANNAGIYTVNIRLPSHNPTIKDEEEILKIISEQISKAIDKSYNDCVGGEGGGAENSCKGRSIRFSGDEAILQKMNEYTRLLLEKHDSKIIPTEKISDTIKSKIKFGGTSSDEITFKLSQALKHIEEAGEMNVNYPKIIFGWFCRSGNSINIKGLMKCSLSRPGLVPLSEDYFSDNIDYGSSLMRGTSIASKNKPQDFWRIYDNIASKIKRFDTTTQEEFKSVRQKIEDDSGHMENGVYKGINLSVDDVCLIFQMDQQLQINSR